MKNLKGIGWFIGAIFCVICLIPKLSNPQEELPLLIAYSVLTVVFVALGIRSMLKRTTDKKQD